MTDEKFAFCSEAWVAVANEYLKESARDTDLTGIEYTFNEVFTNAPVELDPDEQGRVGWYLRIADGEVEARRGILEDADTCIQSDYDSILPLARIVFAGNAEATAAAQKTMQALIESGKFIHTTKVESPPEMPWTGALHDVLARRTL